MSAGASEGSWASQLGTSLVACVAIFGAVVVLLLVVWGGRTPHSNSSSASSPTAGGGMMNLFFALLSHLRRVKQIEAVLIQCGYRPSVRPPKLSSHSTARTVSSHANLYPPARSASGFTANTPHAFPQTALAKRQLGRAQSDHLMAGFVLEGAEGGGVAGKRPPQLSLHAANQFGRCPSTGVSPHPSFPWLALPRSPSHCRFPSNSSPLSLSLPQVCLRPLSSVLHPPSQFLHLQSHPLPPPPFHVLFCLCVGSVISSPCCRVSQRVCVMRPSCYVCVWYIHTHTDAHTHTYTNTHVYTHTYTHTRTCYMCLSCSSKWSIDGRYMCIFVCVCTCTCTHMCKHTNI